MAIPRISLLTVLVDLALCMKTEVKFLLVASVSPTSEYSV